MKTRIKHLLTVLALATVTSFASCQKKTPDPVNYDGISFLSLPAESGYNTYVQSTLEIPFTVNTSVADKCSVTVLSTEGDVWSTVSYDKATGNGKVKAMLNAGSSGSVSVRASVEGSSKTYTIKLNAYYFKMYVNGTLTLDPQSGSRGVAPLQVDTNLDQWEIVLQSKDESLFRVEGDNVVTTCENKTGFERSATVTAREAGGKFNNTVSFKVVQKSAERSDSDDFVRFNDWAFMKAMLEIADTNRDGDIDTAEALAVTEINVAGKGIRDITGIGAFKNAWKFDAQDNDIIDGSEIAQMPSLYWLDLKGNKNLSTFDVTGCTLYFQHCEFEITDNLVYYTTRQQVQVTNASDRMCEHSRHVLDPRQTTDWSDQDETVLIKRHTEGKGYPIILTGISYIDIDMQDGSFMRMMNDMVDIISQYDAVIKDYAKYIDFYAVKHKAVDRNQYFIEMDETNLDNPKMEQVFSKVKKDQVELFEKIYTEFFPDVDSKNEMFPIFVEVNPSASSMLPMREDWGINVLTQKSEMQMYYLHVTMASNNEKAYAGTLSNPINTTTNSILEYLKKRTENLEYLHKFFETNVKN